MVVAANTLSTRERASARYLARAFNLEDFFDLELRLRQLFARDPQPLDAFFEQLQRLVQIEIFRFEPAHDGLEALELLTELWHQPLRPSRAAATPCPTAVARRASGSCRARPWPPRSRGPAP